MKVAVKKKQVARAADEVVPPTNRSDFDRDVRKHTLGPEASRLLGVLLEAKVTGLTDRYFSREELMSLLKITHGYHFDAVLELAKKFSHKHFDELVGNATGQGWKLCSDQDEVDAELIKSCCRSLAHMRSFSRKYSKFGRNQKQIAGEKDADLREVALHLDMKYQGTNALMKHDELQMSRCRSLLGPRLPKGVLTVTTPLKQIEGEKQELAGERQRVINLAEQLKKNRI